MKCLRGASAVQSVLEANPDPQVRVFVVWLPILPTDFTPPNTSAMSRVREAESSSSGTPIISSPKQSLRQRADRNPSRIVASRTGFSGIWRPCIRKARAGKAGFRPRRSSTAL